MAQEIGRSAGRFRETNHGALNRLRILAGEHPNEIRDVTFTSGLIEGDADAAILEETQVDPFLMTSVANIPGVGTADTQGVEEFAVAQFQSEGFQSVGQSGRQFVNTPGDASKAVRPVPDCVHRRHDGEQNLGRADIARGLFPSDMLFAGLQSKAQGRPAPDVFGDAHDTSRQKALELVERRKEGGVGSAEAE